MKTLSIIFLLLCASLSMGQLQKRTPKPQPKQVSSDTTISRVAIFETLKGQLKQVEDKISLTPEGKQRDAIIAQLQFIQAIKNDSLYFSK